MKILTNHHHLLLLYNKPPNPQISLLIFTAQKFPSLKTITNTKKPQTFSPIPSLSSKSKHSLSPNPNPNPNPNLNPPPPMATCIGAAQPSPLSRDPNRPHPDDSAAGNASHGLNFLKLSRRKFSDHAPKSSAATAAATAAATTVFRDRKPVIGDHDDDDDDDDLDLWREIKSEALSDAESEPVLKPYLVDSVLSHASLESALASQLSVKLGRDSSIPRQALYEIFVQVLGEDPEIVRSTVFDLRAVKERDPACISHVHCLLNFKGFLAIQAHRMAHCLWARGRRALALTLQSRSSEAFAVDIHPGARVGRGVLLDHATGVVVGETAVIGDHVSILHNVTLGGTGKACGDRHPKIGDGVLIGAGTCILGNIRIGEGAKIGAGSVVLKDVPAWTTAVGNPARLIGGKNNPVRNHKVPGLTMDHTSHISEWSDYVI